MSIKNAANAEKKAPLNSGEWKKVIEREELDQYCVQDIVRAAREINISGDRMVFTALMGHISDQMLRVLRAYVSTNHHNGGRDIIHDVQNKMIRALLDPRSKDGDALCKAFVPRMQFRALDEIKRETKRRSRYPSSDDVPDDIFKEKSHRPFDQIEKNIYVDQILDMIPDHRKRLAFRLYMDGCPIESSRGVDSISETVDKTPRTVGTWIREIQALLQAKIGEDHE